MPSKGTKKVYKSGLKKFLEWYGKSAEEVLKERKDDLTQRPDKDLVTEFCGRFLHCDESSNLGLNRF